ncbi:Replication factor C, subunit RFC4 [Sorochytrium milnesiophthora]
MAQDIPKIDMSALGDEKQREAEFDRAVTEGAVRGAIIGAAVGVSAILLGNRYSPTIRQLTVPFKTFIGTSALTAGLMIGGENATFYTPASRYHYHQVLVDESHKQHDEELRRESPWDRIKHELIDKRYTITGGIWIASMGISGLILYRKKHMNIGQKLVEARMYAQAAVLVSLLATAGLASLGPSHHVRRHGEAAAAHFPKPHAYDWETEEQSKLKVQAPAKPIV